MSEEEMRAAVERHWRASAARDQGAEHEIYAEDVISVFPQAGDRIVRQNLGLCAATIPLTVWVPRRSDPGIRRSPDHRVHQGGVGHR